MGDGAAFYRWDPRERLEKLDMTVMMNGRYLRFLGIPRLSAITGLPAALGADTTRRRRAMDDLCRDLLTLAPRED